MAQNNRINFQLDFKKGDTSVLDSLKKDLQEIQRLAGDYDYSTAGQEEMKKMVTAAKTVERALTQAFDPNLNTVNIQKFNNILKQSGYNAQTLQADLANAGAVGQQAFLKMTGQLMQFNTAAKQTNKFLDGIATSFFNTVKWGIMSSIMNNISGTIQKSYYYVKDLDSALNDIRIVTGKSADEMSRFAEQANNAAKSLAVTTEDYTQGSLIYYQQGLDDSTVKTLTDITAKTSNVTGQSMETVSEQLTAVWNGYKVANEAAEEGMQVYEEYVDKMAAVGATTASDLQELSTAMSKVASAANSMGVDFDDLNAQIATIVSVTRQAPESVGTALKTIYARLGDLKVDGVDEFGVKLGDVTKQLQTMGINILDQNGNMRQMSTVMTEVAEKWDTWTSAQRQAAAVAMAGKRQYNNLVALFDNWDMYGEALETSMNAAGTLEKQQEIAMDSLANKMDVLKATAEDLYDSLFNTDTISDFIETGTGVLQFFADFTDAVGGLNNILPMLGSLGLQVFSEQIGRGLSTIVINARNATQEAQMMKDNFEQIKLMYSDASIFNSGGFGEASAAQIQEIERYYEKMYQYQSIMNQEQKDSYNNILNSKVEIGNTAVALEEEINHWRIINEQSNLLDNSLINDVEKFNELNIQASALNEASKTLSQYFNSTFNWEKFNTNDNSGIVKLKNDFEEVLNISKELGQITEEQFTSLNNRVNNLDSFPKVRVEIERIIEELRELGATSDAINQARMKMDQLSNSVKVLDKNLTDTLSTEQFLMNITKTVGAVGQLTSSIQTLKNLGKIWDNEDISTTDKMLQTLTNVSFVLPNLISSFSTFGKVTGYTTGILGTFQAKSALNNSISLLNAAGYNVEAKALKGKTQQEIEDILITEYLAKNEIKLKGVRLLSIAGLTAEQKQLLLDSMAKTADNEATKKLTASQLALNKSLLLMNINPVVAGITVLVAAVAAVALAYNKANKEQLEFAKNQIEETKAIQEEIDANQKLYKEYSKTFEAYEEGNATKEELLTATESICEAYDIEIDKLDVLTNKYQNLTKEINEKRQAELKAAQENLTRQKSNQVVSSFQTAREGIGRKLGNDYLLEIYNPLARINDTYDYQLSNFLRQRVTAEETNNSKNSTAVGWKIDYNNMEQMLQLYDELSAAAAEYINTYGVEATTNSSEFQNLSDWLNRVGPELDDYRATIEQLKETDSLYEISKIDFSSVRTLDEYNEKVEEIANTLETKYNYSQEEAINLAKKYAGQVNTTTKDLSLQESILESIADRTKKSIDEVHQWWDNLPEEDKLLILQGKVDFTYISNIDTIKDEIAFAKNQLQTFDVTKLTSISGTLASGTKLKKDDNEILEELESSDAEAMAGFNEKSLLHQLDVIDEITQKRIAANQEYLEDTQRVVQEEIDLRKKEQEDIFKTEEEYNEAKDKLKDSNLSEEERKEIQKTIDDYEALQLAIENLKKIKEEGLSWEEIDTLGFDNLIAKIDMVTNKAESLQTAAELIGEGFTVAASDVEKFAATFPELLENMEVLSDGSLQLSKETVQENIAGIKAELEARTEAQLAEIDQQIELKKLDIEFTKKRLENIQAFLKGEQTAGQTKINLANTTHNYEQKLRDLTGEDIEKLANFSIESSVKEASSVTEAIDAIGSAWAEVSRAHAAAIEGVEYDWKGASFKGTASTVDEYVSSIGDKARRAYEEYQEEYEEAFHAAEKLQSQYNTLNGELDELNAKRAVIESTSNAAINALDRVAAGKAGKESKDKSGKDKKDKEKKELEDEFDRYWDIKKAIEEVDHAVSILEKDQKNLHGKELISSLKKENELIKEQTENYQKLYAAQQEEAKELGAILRGKGLEFTEDGAISNYAEATTAALAKYNKAVDAYNAGALDDAGFEIAEKSYERFKKQLERYEELYYKEMQDTFDKIDDNNRKVLENNLKAWETEIQVQLDLNEAERNWSKFFKEINTDFKKVFKDLGAEMSAIAKEAGTYQSDIAVDIKAINDTMAEIDKLNADQATDHTQAISEAQEKLKDLNDQLMDHAKSLRGAFEDAWDAYLEGIDQAAEKFDKLNDQFDRVNDQLEFQGELIELMYGEKAYGLMDKLYEGQEHASRNQIQSVQEQLNFWKKLYEETSEGDKDHEKALEKMNELQDKLNDLTLDYIKILKDEYANSIKGILDELDKTLTGGIGTSMAAEQWERMKSFSDTYFDDFEGAYHIQTLVNKVEKDINKTYKDNEKVQQKLVKYEDQILKKLKDIKNLRKEDFDIANAEYELLLAEIALEEAQNNKTAMKLVRNEQGNWSYQYVADEEENENKKQDKLDANYNVYNIAKEAYGKVVEEQLKYNEESQSKALELADKFANDQTLTEEQKNEQIQKLQDDYLKKYNASYEKAQYYYDKMRVAGAALGIELYQEDDTYFENMLDSEKLAFDNLIASQKTGYLEVDEAFKNNTAEMDIISQAFMERTRNDWKTSSEMLQTLWNGDEESVRAAVETATDAMEAKADEYSEKISDLEELVGLKFIGEEGESSIVNSIKAAKDETDILKGKTTELVNESTTKLEELKDKLGETENSWYKVADSIQTCIDKLATYLKMQGKEYTGGAVSVEVPDAKTDRNEVASSKSTTKGGGKGGNGENPPKPEATYTNYTVQSDPNGVYGTKGLYYNGELKLVTDENNTNKDIENYLKEQGMSDKDIEALRNTMKNSKEYVGFNSGGYTGDWNGDNGRLAILHKKEMVLNADDTENLLRTVKISNALMEMAKATINDGLISMQKANYNYSAGASSESTNTGTTFYIDRLEFPNANSVDEIKMAIMSLPNVASQYVNRNVK